MLQFGSSLLTDTTLCPIDASFQEFYGNREVYHKIVSLVLPLYYQSIIQSGSFPQNWSGDGEGEWRTYGAVVEVEEGRAEELGPLPEDLLGPRAVVGRRRVVEGRHLRGRSGGILRRGRRGDGRGEAGVGPGGGERGPEEPPGGGGGEALHAWLLCGSLSRAARAGGGTASRSWPRRVCELLVNAGGGHGDRRL